MKFAYFEEFFQKWKDILVIGRTMEMGGRKCHMIGMTLADEAKLYILEPYIEPERDCKKSVRTHRRILKEQRTDECSYIHCKEFCFGNERLQVKSGMGSPLKYAFEEYGSIQLFFDMLRAGWVIPEWLKEADWDDLHLVTLTLADVKKLPACLAQTPVRIVHRPTPVSHLLEKTVTLTVGKARAFSFTDTHGDTVQCYINNVTLIDVWEDTEKQWANAETTAQFTPKELRQAKKHCYDALAQSCPKGMCYVGVEYECSKDLRLRFYSKQYLKSCPQMGNGSASFFVFSPKLERGFGTHGLPLRACVIDTPFSPDTVKIGAELFSYCEMGEEWVETVL